MLILKIDSVKSIIMFTGVNWGQLAVGQPRLLSFQLRQSLTCSPNANSLPCMRQMLDNARDYGGVIRSEFMYVPSNPLLVASNQDQLRFGRLKKRESTCPMCTAPSGKSTPLFLAPLIALKTLTSNHEPQARHIGAFKTIVRDGSEVPALRSRPR